MGAREPPCGPLCRYKCDCDPGWSGANCDVNNNECESNPCANGGACRDMTSGYVCTCREGFSGERAGPGGGLWGDPRCLPPAMGASCCRGGRSAGLWLQPRRRRGSCSGSCHSPVGMGMPTAGALSPGPNCQTNINECASNPCLNQGSCIDDVAGYKCNCPLPYTGEGGAGQPREAWHGTAGAFPGLAWPCGSVSTPLGPAFHLEARPGHTQASPRWRPCQTHSKRTGRQGDVVNRSLSQTAGFAGQPTREVGSSAAQPGAGPGLLVSTAWCPHCMGPWGPSCPPQPCWPGLRDPFDGRPSLCRGTRSPL